MEVNAWQVIGFALMTFGAISNDSLDLLPSDLSESLGCEDWASASLYA